MHEHSDGYSYSLSRGRFGEVNVDHFRHSRGHVVERLRDDGSDKRNFHDLDVDDFDDRILDFCVHDLRDEHAVGVTRTSEVFFRSARRWTQNFRSARRWSADDLHR